VTTYKCGVCGSTHEGPPLSYGFGAPAYWRDECRSKDDCVLGGEQCIIEGRYYVKANIELPIIGQDERFVWTVWVSLSKENFERASLLWEDPKRVDEPPYFGWLASSIPTYPETVNLKTHVHTRDVGLRPLIELEPTDHPLAFQQREGITFEEVVKLAERLLHE